MGGSRGGGGGGGPFRAIEQMNQKLRLAAQQAAAAAQARAIAEAQAKAAAERAAREAQLAFERKVAGENTDAAQRMQESFKTATSGVLPRLQQASASEDMARQQNLAGTYASAGGAATGGGADLGSIRQQALANIGVAAPTGAGVTGAASTNNNPPAGMPQNVAAMAAANAMTGGTNAPVNQFRPPNAANLAFGGS